MRISDWSSDVCSSDLGANDAARAQACTLPYAHAIFNHAMRTYGDPRFDSGRGRNDGAAMYARRKAIEAMPVKPLRQQRVHQIGFVAQYGKKAIAHCFQR